MNLTPPWNRKQQHRQERARLLGPLARDFHLAVPSFPGGSDGDNFFGGHFLQGCCEYTGSATGGEPVGRQLSSQSCRASSSVDLLLLSPLPGAVPWPWLCSGPCPSWPRPVPPPLRRLPQDVHLETASLKRRSTLANVL